MPRGHISGRFRVASWKPAVPALVTRPQYPAGDEAEVTVEVSHSHQIEDPRSSVGCPPQSRRRRQVPGVALRGPGGATVCAQRGRAMCA
jgi:hypothetical protein